MQRQQHAAQREQIIAKAISGFTRELHMIDPIDLAAFLRLDLHANLADLIKSAAELSFAPDFLTLGQGGRAVVEWSEPLEIDIDLVMKPAGATVNFTLKLKAESAEVRLAYISFDNPAETPEENTRFLRDAISKYMIDPNALTMDQAETGQ